MTPPRAERSNTPPKSNSTTPSVPIIAPPVPKDIPTPPAGNLGIAIIWHGNADIDLHVAASMGLPEASWNRPSVERVRHFRDVRAPQSSRGSSLWQSTWEYCEVSQALLTEPTLWLNAYEASEPVNGIIRVQFRGKVEDRVFSFPISRGDRGRDGEPTSRARSPYWQRINLTDFFPSSVEATVHH